jgi:acyl dehydratase
MFGQRIAHGMLVLSVATGLAARLGFIEGTALAFRELTWKFSQPVFFGDTIYMKATCKETKPMPRLGGGVVKFDVRVANQDGKTVQRGEWQLLMASRPQD